MSICLTQDEIEGLLAGNLAREHHARVAAHLADCETCRRQVESRQADGQLLDKIRQAYESETVSSPCASRAAQASTAPVTQSIEGYEILGEIHRGGQGVVYKAIQKATKRTVAIKVLLEGPYASPQHRHRFEREIDLVANLQHPNIVTLYDSGVTDDARHYFAMEYIRGKPLNVHAAEAKVGIRDCLQLFQRVCAAVSCAHQRGVIHRDLKPGNIHVDATGSPHILDFGLAKGAGLTLTGDGAPVTLTGEFVGTLTYASPEQTKGDPSLIDTRTDIYSLGVILYELLTGTFPYPVTDQIADVLRNINEAVPAKPSALRPEIDDEVDTIVLKALAKEKERRYQSVNALGDDVERYLAGEPIEAKRDSRLYVLKKTLVHYKRQALIFAVTFVIVSSAIASAGYFWHETREKGVLLAQRRHADQLVSDARHLIEVRSLLPKAQSYLDEALGLAPNHEHAYMQRGLLKAFFGLDARIEHKATWVDEAVDDFRQAHQAAGERGSRCALLTAANLLLMSGRQAEAEVAARAAEALPNRDEDPNVVHVPVYDVRWDPLTIASESLSRSPAAARVQPDYAAIVRRTLNDPVLSLDPLDAAGGRQFEIVELLFDPLFRIELVEVGDLGVRPNPALVKGDPTISDDGLTWRVNLHPDLTWHDGHPLTARDVAFAWNRQAEERGAIRSVEAVADDLVQITFGELTSTAEWELLFCPVPEHLCDQHEPGFDEQFGRRPIGNGPYRWCPHSTADAIILERWDAYSGTPPYLAAIEFHVIPEPDRRIQALADGRVDVLDLSGGEFRWAVNGQSFEKHVAKIVQPTWSHVYICWNGDGSNPFFGDPNVRRAMTHAMNLRRIIDQRFGGLYSLCAGIYSPGSWMFNPDVDPLEYDPEHAKTLLDAAGWTIAEGGGDIRVRDGEQFQFSLLVSEGSVDFRALAYELQRDLRAVGVLMRIETAPWLDCLTRTKQGRFEASALQLRTSPHPDQDRARWKTGAEYNYANYSNPEVDELYDLARRTTNRARQREYYQRIQKLIYQDQPHTFLWQTQTLLAVNKRLRGVQLSPLGITGCHPGMRAWWLPATDE